MSKDRRLGRGLAALLGTPLDEPLSGDPSSMVNAAVTPPPGNIDVAVAGDSDESGESTRAEMIRKLNGQAHASAAASKRMETVDDLTPSRAVLELPLNQIDNNPFQPRREFNPEEIASLAESLKEHEQLQPVLVRRVGDRFQLISGERRLRAAIQAGMRTIRAEIRQADDRLVAELAIIENLQRKDLNPIEKALSFKRYVTEHRCTQEDLAKRLKIDRSTIANMMRLLELPDPIQSAIQRDEISAGHARSLLPLSDEKEQLEFARKAKEEGWSVRETERRVAEALAHEDAIESGEDGAATQSAKKRTKSEHLASLEQELKMMLGTKVEIRQTATGKGKIVISFANAEEFERLRGSFSTSTGSGMRRRAA